MDNAAPEPRPLNGIIVTVQPIGQDEQPIGNPRVCVWTAADVAKYNNPAAVMSKVIGPEVCNALLRQPPPPKIIIAGAIPQAVG